MPPPLLFSRRDYCLSLPHIGRPVPADGLDATLLVRAIPGTERSDLVGPWPYTVAPRPSRGGPAFEALRREGYVSLTMFLRPDVPPSELEALRAALDGVAELAPLKDHYVRDPDLPAPTLRARTRKNLRMSQRHWHLRRLAQAEIAPVCTVLQSQLAARRQLSHYARVPDRHFQVIATLEGIEAVAAVDADGPGAVLIAARSGCETHLLHFLTSPRVIRTGGSYLLWMEAVRQWSGDGCVYLGGAPGSAAGPGVARFKARWANRTAPVHLLKAILDEAAYRAFAAGAPGDGSFFPAYRSAGA